ncbi:MAG: DUF5615 family PIN-like protein [Xenococcaceae cyanobacterium MO_167.B52]|nr:DUF5615 family PIN-like protein [Xenococcaceae cyanobacterium MO_167.B52]
MNDKIKFHLDEHVKSAIARELRRRGIDVTTTVEVGLRTKTDEEQLEFIRQEKRVIFTQDDDFLKIASQTINHPGIVYCRQGTRSIGEIVESLALIYEVYSPEDIQGTVEFI